MRTLQEQYNAIKNGKGNKAQFLKQARHLFPQYINQYSDFDTATGVLKSKQIISEAAGGVVAKGFDIWDWKKILAEEAKATEKETSKEVLDAQAHTYDNKDMKNADNVNFNEIMKGFYCEMKDEKNKDKTGDELKAIVVKNLAKDPLYYTKNGEFGTKGVGYTTEAPGLGEPKEPKGKHKSSGYGDLDTKTEKVKANVQDSLGDKEAKTSNPSKVKEMPVTPQNSAGVKKMPMPGSEKTMKLQEDIGMFNDRIGYKKSKPSDLDKMFTKEYKGNGVYVIYKNGEEVKTIEGEGNANAWINDEMRKLKENTDVLDQYLSIIDSNKMSKDEAYDYLENETDLNSSQINTIMNYAFPLKADKDIPSQGMTESEQKLRSLIQQIIKEELNGANLSEEMNWDKFNIQVSSDNYEGTIKRDSEGWMMYDEDNQPEEAGPFKTLDSLMSYYDLIKSDLVGDYVKNLNEGSIPAKAEKIADKVIKWYENHPNPKMKELLNSVEKNIEKMLSKTTGKDAISVEEFEKIVKSKYGKPFEDPNYSVFKKATNK